MTDTKGKAGEILAIAKFHRFEGEDFEPGDYEIFNEDVKCPECILVHIVRAENEKQ